MLYQKTDNLCIYIYKDEDYFNFVGYKMKTMTCKQLGGACSKEFHANTFEEMKQMSQKHAHEMYKNGDERHIKVMKEMMELMKDSEAMKKWMENKEKEFDALPKNK